MSASDETTAENPSDGDGAMCMGNTHPKCIYVPRGKCSRKDQKHNWHKCNKCDKEWHHTN